jgi:Domain of unknown function (DUF4123)
MDQSLDKKLMEILFPCDGEVNTYAVIDGASCKDLLKKLGDFTPDNCCLYAGALEAEMEKVAPYLVHLKQDHPFTEWLLTNFIGNPWCIFSHSPADFGAMRKHFRTLLLVRGPEGELLYFRYYDPRVLSIYLPTTNEEERKMVFGPVNAYFCETEKDNFAGFGLSKGELTKRWFC